MQNAKNKHIVLVVLERRWWYHSVRIMGKKEFEVKMRPVPVITIVILLFFCVAAESRLPADISIRQPVGETTESEPIKISLKGAGITDCPGYSLTRPDKKYDMPSELLEISGITLLNEKTVACVQDENAVIYYYSLEGKKVEDALAFGGRGDFEDIARDGNRFFALRSDAVVYTVEGKNGTYPKIRRFKVKTDADDHEGLFYDKKNEVLIMAVKSGMENDDRTGCRYLYILKERNGRFDVRETVRLDPGIFFSMLPGGFGNIRFNPSAVAVHPVTDELYILSASDRVLVRTDREGTVMGAYPLDPDIFNKPEGITFLPNGDMLISNEGNSKKHIPGNILYFPFISE